MRQANLKLEDLKRELEKPKTKLPKCLIVKEIGEFLIVEGDEGAEDILVGFLEEKEVTEKFIAFCCLCSVESDSLKKETREKLKAFRENLENEELIVLSEKAMPHFRQKTSELLRQEAIN